MHRVWSCRWRALGLAAVLLAAPAGAIEDLTFQVRGQDDDVESALRNASLLVDLQQSPTDEGGPTDPVEILATARADYARLLEALYANGYYGGVISITVNGQEAAEVPPLDAPERIDDVAVVVDPGPLYTFGTARAAPLAPETELPDGFAAGEPAEARVVRNAARAAVDGWRRATFAKAAVAEQRVVARHADDRLDAEIDIATGPSVTFGQIAFQGAETIRERRLRQIAGFPAGRPFDPDEVEKVVRRLRETGVFASVALEEGEALGPGATLDYTALLAERLPRRFGAGAELSTVEGLRLTAFWLHRNFFGGAERLRVEGEVAGIGGSTGGEDYRFNTRLERPATFTTSTDLFVEGEIEREQEPDFTSNSGRLGFGFTKTFGEDLEGSIGLEYSYTEIEDDLGRTDYTFVNVPLGLTYDTRQNEFDPTGGLFLQGEARPFYRFEDDNVGTRVTGDARSYAGFGADDRVVLAGRLQVGSILSGELTDLPNDDRFYSGGGGTVRGQEYQDLGVEIADGVRSGGKSFLGVQAEARVGVTEKIGVVAFYDYGYIGLESEPLSAGDSHSGAGVGVRYDTGIGPLRVDVGVPVSDGGPEFEDDEEDASFQVYIGIGQAF